MEKDVKMNSENPDEMEAELGNPGDQMGTEPMEQVPSYLCYTFGLYFPDCFALLVIVNRGPWLSASSTYDSELAFCESLNLGKKSSTSCMMTVV
ncbi:hypothetical protein M5689_000346 [Euphorbia peplus]|nr:hypothetical protein M5689_000346 [Euphorbia peplus]